MSNNKNLFMLLFFILSSNLMAKQPTIHSIRLLNINQDEVVNMIRNESITISLHGVDDGEKTNTKRKYFASKDGVKGQGKFGFISHNEAMWEAPNEEGIYTLGVYIENNDGISAILKKNITVVNQSNSCPINFVYIPNSQNIEGSPLGWCVMKYEATPYNANAGWVKDNITTHAWVMQDSYETDITKKITSKPFEDLIAYVSSTNARTFCANQLVDTNGKKIDNGFPIKYNVWKILVKDIASNPANWSSGVVGSGYMYNGHSDNVPPHTIQASNNDNDGYYLTNNSDGNQKRTLFTSNGGAIWDLTGNIYDVIYEQQDIGFPDDAWNSYTTGSLNAFSPSVIMGYSNEWNNYNSVGQTHGDNTDSCSADKILTKGKYNIAIGGRFGTGSYLAGIFLSNWQNATITEHNDYTGFRCITPAK